MSMFFAISVSAMGLAIGIALLLVKVVSACGM